VGIWNAITSAVKKVVDYVKALFTHKEAKEDTEKCYANGNDKKVGKTEQKCPLKKYKIIDLTLLVDTPEGKVIMDDPDRKVEVSAVMTYTKSDDPKDLDALPKNVSFSFNDPKTNNTNKNDSYKYSAKYLGKKGDAKAKYWEAHSEHSASSKDKKCKVLLKTLEKEKKEIAKVYFKPSGVGGDDFEIEATVFHSDEIIEIISAKADRLTIWRSVTFDNIYEMQGQTHVSTNAATGTISPVYDSAFVEYTAGSRTEIVAAKSVKYIGLWKDTSTTQVNWADLQEKRDDEKPTNDEIKEATYAGTDAAEITKRATARAKIIAKAQKWTNRIDSSFHSAMPKWIKDAGIPNNALIAIQYYHPKYSPGAGNAATSEWDLGGDSTPEWLKVVGAFAKSGGGYHYENLDPDSSWIPGGARWAGLSHGSGIVSAPIGMSSNTLKQVIRHEAGHATKSHFKRDVFGPSLDHSASNAGIMYYNTSGGTTFTNREKKILRGIKT